MRPHSKRQMSHSSTTPHGTRLVQGGLLAVAASWGVFWGGWAALVPQVKGEWGLTDQQLGSTLFAVPIAAVPSMLATGWLIRRWAQRTLPLVTAVFALGCLLVGIAPTRQALVGALLTVGAASGAIEVALNATVAAHESSTGRRLFNKVHAATPLAMVLAAPAVGLAREFATPAVAVLAVMAVLVGISSVLALNGADGSSHPPEATVRTTARTLSATVLLVGSIGAIVLVMENAVEQWGALHMEQQLGTGPMVASLAPAGYMTGLSIGRMLAQWCGDRLGGRVIVPVGGLLGTVGLTVGALQSIPMVVLVGFVLAGIGLAPVIPTLLGIAGRATQAQHRSTVISLITTVSYAGFLTSPLMVGMLAGWFGLSTALTVLAAGGVLVAATSCLSLNHRSAP